jgi:hypothetical protein
MGWCPLRHMSYLVHVLTRSGLMVRVTGPRQVMAGLERLVRLQLGLVTGRSGSSAGSSATMGIEQSGAGGGASSSSGTGRKDEATGIGGSGTSTDAAAWVAGHTLQQAAGLAAGQQQPLWLSVTAAVAAAQQGGRQVSGTAGAGPGMVGMAGIADDGGAGAGTAAGVSVDALLD